MLCVYTICRRLLSKYGISPPWYLLQAVLTTLQHCKRCVYAEHNYCSRYFVHSFMLGIVMAVYMLFTCFMIDTVKAVDMLVTSLN